MLDADSFKIAHTGRLSLHMAGVVSRQTIVMVVVVVVVVVNVVECPDVLIIEVCLMVYVLCTL